MDTLDPKTAMLFQYQLAKFKEDIASGTKSSIALKVAWEFLTSHAAHVANWVITTRSIPAGKAKLLEAGVKAAKQSRTPDPVAWWAKNQAGIELLADALRWPPRSEESGSSDIPETVKVGPMTLHNTLQLQGDKLDTTVQVLQDAEKFLRAANFEEVVYGPVYVVGELHSSRTLAWYQPGTDKVFLRPHLKKGQGEVFNLIHEMGHRYWAKNMSREQQRHITRLYTELSYSSVTLPEVGEPVAITIKGFKNPVVLEFQGLKYGVGEAGSTNVKGYIGYQAMQQAYRALNFPTRYSATSKEELFAECFALYCLGDLTGPVLDIFKAATAH